MSFRFAKIERSREENQERAFIAASRRSDRSMQARVESARRASALHKKRTGKALKITPKDVENEEMYEEEDTEGEPSTPNPSYWTMRLNQPISPSFYHSALQARNPPYIPRPQRPLNRNFTDSYYPTNLNPTTSHSFDQSMPRGGSSFNKLLPDNEGTKLENISHLNKQRSTSKPERYNEFFNIRPFSNLGNNFQNSRVYGDERQEHYFNQFENPILDDDAPVTFNRYSIKDQELFNQIEYCLENFDKDLSPVTPIKCSQSTQSFDADNYLFDSNINQSFAPPLQDTSALLELDLPENLDQYLDDFKFIDKSPASRSNSQYEYN